MKYLKIILLSFLIATAFSVAGVFLLQSIDLIGRADTDLKNMPYGIAIGFNVLLALGTFPIFLNRNSQVSKHILLSALSFFLLPVVIMVCLAFSLEEEAWTCVLFCMPYFIVLSVFFKRYRNI